MQGISTQNSTVHISNYKHAMRKPKFSFIHFYPYVCISEPFTARPVNLHDSDFLSAAVAVKRDTCVPLSPNIPVVLSVA